MTLYHQLPKNAQRPCKATSKGLMLSLASTQPRLLTINTITLQAGVGATQPALRTTITLQAGVGATQPALRRESTTWQQDNMAANQ
ncbi:hypothetical protein AMTR_s00129p00101770 [Amborella trichopoda]|uniref:Uncharacterized protein n=1 Tax=Amborella trichopoda TaxID=13333 RepID=W1NLG3_AMBTC|nr:hypothetical protein AMTR_s00129p00101770 [Amborella trichopoda]